MEFEVWTKGLATLTVDCIVLGIFEEGELWGEAHSVDSACAGRLKKLLARGDFSGRTGETLLRHRPAGLAAPRGCCSPVLAQEEFRAQDLAQGLPERARRASRARASRAAPSPSTARTARSSTTTISGAVAEIAGTALYRVNDLKTGKKPPPRPCRGCSPVRRARPAATERGLEHGAARGGRRHDPARSCQSARATSARRPTSPSRRRRSASAIGLRVQVLDEAGHPPREDGLPAGGVAGQRAAAALHRARAPRRQGERTPRWCWWAKASPSTPAASR